MTRHAAESPYAGFCGLGSNPGESFGLHHAVLLTFAAIGPGAQAAVPLLASDYRDPTNPLRFDAAFARWRIDGKFEEIAPVFASLASEPELRLRGLRLPDLAL